MKWDEINNKETYFANIITEAIGKKLGEFLESMVKSIKKDNPDIEEEFLEKLMWSFMDGLQSYAFYNIGVSTYNRLSQEGFWGQCEPNDCGDCGQSCRLPKDA